MSQKGTPVNMNVNKYLSKIDFRISLRMNCVWPWPVTHFVRRDVCYMCRTTVDSGREHMVVTLDKVKRAQLLEEPSFWCERCTYCLYRHLQPDDCDYCQLYL